MGDGAGGGLVEVGEGGDVEVLEGETTVDAYGRDFTNGRDCR